MNNYVDFFVSYFYMSQIFSFFLFQNDLDDATDRWGVDVQKVEMYVLHAEKYIPI